MRAGVVLGTARSSWPPLSLLSRFARSTAASNSSRAARTSSASTVGAACRDTGRSAVSTPVVRRVAPRTRRRSGRPPATTGVPFAAGSGADSRGDTRRGRRRGLSESPSSSGAASTSAAGEGTGPVGGTAEAAAAAGAVGETGAAGASSAASGVFAAAATAVSAAVAVLPVVLPVTSSEDGTVTSAVTPPPGVRDRATVISQRRASVPTTNRPRTFVGTTSSRSRRIRRAFSSSSRSGLMPRPWSATTTTASSPERTPTPRPGCPPARTTPRSPGVRPSSASGRR